MMGQSANQKSYPEYLGPQVTRPILAFLRARAAPYIAATSEIQYGMLKSTQSFVSAHPFRFLHRKHSTLQIQHGSTIHSTGGENNRRRPMQAEAKSAILSQRFLFPVSTTSEWVRIGICRRVVIWNRVSGTVNFGRWQLRILPRTYKHALPFSTSLLSAQVFLSLPLWFEP